MRRPSFHVKYHGGGLSPTGQVFFLIDNQQGCISVILFYIMHLYSLFASLGKKTQLKATAYISVLLVSIASYLAPSHAFEELPSLKMMFHMKVVLIFPLLLI
jgi:hypothetical protein